MPPKPADNKSPKDHEKQEKDDEPAEPDENDDAESSDNDSTFSCISCLQVENLDLTKQLWALTEKLNKEKREKNAEETARKQAEQRAKKSASALVAAKFDSDEEKRGKKKEKERATLAEQRADKLAANLLEEKRKAAKEERDKKAAVQRVDEAKQQAKEATDALAIEKRKSAKEEKDKKAAVQRADEVEQRAKEETAALTAEKRKAAKEEKHSKEATQRVKDAEKRILELEERLEKANTKPDTNDVSVQSDFPESVPQMPEHFLNLIPLPQNPTRSEEAPQSQQQLDEANTSSSSKKRKKKKPDPKNPGTSSQSSQNSANSPKEDAPATKLDMLEKIRNALPLQVGPAPALPKPDAENLPSVTKKQKVKAEQKSVDDDDDAFLASCRQKQNAEYSNTLKDLEECIENGNYLNVVEKINKVVVSNLPHDTTNGETYLFFLLHIIHLASDKPSPSVKMWAQVAECAFRKYLAEHHEEEGGAEYATLLLVSILYKLPLSLIETIINYDSAAMITPARINSESNCGVPIILACKSNHNWEWLLNKLIEQDGLGPQDKLMQIYVACDILNKGKEEKCIKHRKSSYSAEALQFIHRSIPDLLDLEGSTSKAHLLTMCPSSAKGIKLCYDFTTAGAKWPSNFKGYELGTEDLHSLAVNSVRDGMLIFAWSCLNNALYERLDLDLLSDRRAIIGALCRNEAGNSIVKQILSPCAYKRLLECQDGAYPPSSSSSSSSEEECSDKDHLEILRSAINTFQNDQVAAILAASEDPLKLVTETYGHGLDALATASMHNNYGAAELILKTCPDLSWDIVDYALDTANNYGADEELRQLLEESLKGKAPPSSSSEDFGLESTGETNHDETNTLAESSSSSSSSISNTCKSEGAENSDDNGNSDCKTIIKKDVYHLNAGFEWLLENFFSYEENYPEQNQDTTNPIVIKIIECLDWIINRLKELGWNDDNPVIQSLEDKKEFYFDGLPSEDIVTTNALPEFFAPEKTTNLEDLIAKNSNMPLLTLAGSGEILPIGALLNNFHECSQEV